MKRCGVGLVVLLFLAELCFSLTLVDNGKPVATLVLPDQPTKLEQVVAADLQRCLKRISGATLPIVSESKRPDTVCLEIGATTAGQALQKELLAQKNISDQTCIIKITDAGGVLVGRNEAATSYAVYVLLERLGVRWLQPSLTWEIVPSSKTISVPNGTQQFAPYFDRRSGMGVTAPTGEQTPEDRIQSWARRNRLGGPSHAVSGHTYNSIIPRSEFEDHPEYFGLWKGQRRYLQLCTTHPEVIRRTIDFTRSICAMAERDINENIKLIVVSPNDGEKGFCECPRCSKLRFAPGNNSDLIMELANQAARAIKEKYPDFYVMFFADYHNVGVPVKVKPEKNIVFWISQWGVDRYQPITHPRQERFKNALANWSKFGNPIHLYVYYAAYNHWLYYPLAHCMKVDFPYFVKYGVKGTYSETPQNWGTQGLNFYLYSRLCWEPTLDVDGLVKEFCDLAFGPAGATMVKYYNLQSEIAAKGSYYYDFDVFATFGPEAVKKLDALMDQAVEQVKAAVAQKPDPELVKRTEYIALAQRVMSLHLRGKHAWSKFNQTRDRKLLDVARRCFQEELQIVKRPEHKYLVDPRYFEYIDYNIASLQELPKYGPGEFEYSDAFVVDGGRSALHAQSVTGGFHPSRWGFQLRAHSQGQVVYKFQAQEDCVFDRVIMIHMNFEFSKEGQLSNKIEVRSPATNLQYVTVFEDTKTEMIDKLDLLGKHVAGVPWFELRFTGRNDSDNNGALSFLNFGVKGQVVPQPAVAPESPASQEPVPSPDG